MKLIISILHASLLLGALSIFASCNRLNKSESVKAQDATIANERMSLEIEQGITVVFQDSRNNYWFGGKEGGVYKYDSKDFVQYSKQDGLCSNSILGIQEDKAGNIYFDTPVGVSKFDGQNFTILEILESNTPQYDWKLEPDDLWFRMGWDNNGPYRFDGNYLHPLEFPKTKQADEFYKNHPNSSYTPYGIYTIYKDNKGSLWFGTASLGLCRYDGKSLSWLYEEQLSKTPRGGDFGIRSIIEDKDGYFWFCNPRYRYKIENESIDSNGTSFIDYKKLKGLEKTLNEKNIPYFLSMTKDDTGNLWMATYDDGVWQKKGTDFIHYPIKDGDKTVLLFSIYKDNQGSLWLGTQNAGVYKLNGTQFEKFSP